MRGMVMLMHIGLTISCVDTVFVIAFVCANNSTTGNRAESLSIASAKYHSSSENATLLYSPFTFSSKHANHLHTQAHIHIRITHPSIPTAFICWFQIFKYSYYLCGRLTQLGVTITQRRKDFFTHLIYMLTVAIRLWKPLTVFVVLRLGP